MGKWTQFIAINWGGLRTPPRPKCKSAPKSACEGGNRIYAFRAFHSYRWRTSSYPRSALDFWKTRKTANSWITQNAAGIGDISLHIRVPRVETPLDTTLCIGGMKIEAYSVRNVDFFWRCEKKCTKSCLDENAAGNPENPFHIRVPHVAIPIISTFWTSTILSARAAPISRNMTTTCPSLKKYLVVSQKIEIEIFCRFNSGTRLDMVKDNIKTWFQQSPRILDQRNEL